MQKTSHLKGQMAIKIKFLNRFLLTVAVIFRSATVEACGPLENFDVYFSKDSAVISQEQLSRLSIWTMELSTKYPRHASIVVSANVQNDESDVMLLGRQRELAVRLALIDMNFTRAPVHVAEKISVRAINGLGGLLSEDVKRVELQLAPDCSQDSP